MSQVRRRAADAMIGASSVCALIAGLAFISDEVRSQIADAIAGKPSELGAMAFRAQAFGQDLGRMAGDYRLTEAPILGFGIVAVLLCFLMFRT